LDFNGSDSFTYKANDGTIDSNVATVTITVGARKTPVAVNDSYNATETAVDDARRQASSGNDTMRTATRSSIV